MTRPTRPAPDHGFPRLDAEPARQPEPARPAAPEELPRAARRVAAPSQRRPASFRERFAANAPIWIVCILLVAIGELMLAQAPLWIFVAVNVLLILLALLIWRLRARRKAQSRGRAHAPRPRSARRGMPGGGLLRGASRWLGLPGGGGRRGGTPTSSGRSRSGRSPLGGGRSSRLGGLARRIAGRGRGSAGGPVGGGRSSRLGGLARRIAGRGRGSAGGAAGSGRPGGGGSAASRGRSGRLLRLGRAFAHGVRKGAQGGTSGPAARRPKTTSPARPATEPARPTERRGGDTVKIFGRGGNNGGDEGNYYRGNGRYGAGADDRSLYSYGRSLSHGPEAFEDFARMLDAWAREGEEDQPADLSIPEAIRAAAQVVRSIGADSTDWASNYRRRHEADEARLESPARGSRHVERKRDVTAAEQDGH